MLSALTREKIAKTFGQSCQSYDDNARLQRFSGTLLCQYLQQLSQQRKISKANLLDLGCGTGYFTQILNEQGFEQITALDLSEEMISFAKQRDYKQGQLNWVLGDAHALPLLKDSNDIIYSNLVLQWTQPLTLALSEAYRILKPGGYMVFSTLVDGTLTELKQAWAKVDDDKHVIDYLSREEVDAAWKSAGFKSIDTHAEPVELPYKNVSHLARELKHLGASLVKDKKCKGLMGKDKWQKMTLAYQQVLAQNTEKVLLPDHINATYQLYTLCIQKPKI
ncbi:malonyl-ACP O-methyltransferase BioC [Thalassotalea sp. PS06]|uniref:malonyl-ACP O-methyltransferase BioC n=1 Tax=Thalassotalea sp. PS06 TaxID=2594005 RepID=UPI001161DA5E|nr:malonyl-ACP O-methyltransferase BioC [Thalassotalea sp. PS06]QDP01312.1 malonyl-ACP O-methyltransferase BioC [Thalassotalea sp. PS06]